MPTEIEHPVSRRPTCVCRRRDSVVLFALAVGLVWSLFGGNGIAAQADQRPNLIVIMADDLGYETIGANGGTSYPTPVLDRLAAGGVRFDQCYVQPLCTPTRVQLMTGIYNVRNYIRFGYMDPQAVTFANVLKQAGYATGIVGKWQLGQDVKLPHKFGYDETCLWQHTRRPPRFANPGLEINGQEHDYSNGEYGPKLVNDFALDFITRHKDGPFVLYYPMILTHDPYQPTPDSPDWDPKAQGERVNRHVRHFGEMVTYMDKMIGRVDSKLEELGIRENTLLIFIGDNGTGKGTPSKMGDRTVIGGKGSTNAAGMHVPLIVSWPGSISKGTVCSDLVDSTDIFPTILAAAGVKVPSEPEIDGRSFLPQLRGETGEPRSWIYCWYSRNGGAREAKEFAFNQRFKLYRDGRFFNLAADRAETRAVPLETLRGEAAATAKLLQTALDKYEPYSSARLKRPGAATGGKQQRPAGKNKNKKKKQPDAGGN